MRSGGGKQKGASFERDVCRRLSLWVSQNKQEDVFWRSAMSGGRATVGFARGKRLASQAGDISAVHKIGNALVDKFLVECKSYKKLDYHGLITGKGKLVEFWTEAKKQSKRYRKQPILIAKQNQLPTVICTTLMGGFMLRTGGIRVMTLPRLDMEICLLDEFFEYAEPPLAAN